MVQTNNRFFDEIGRLMNGAAGMTQGLRREMESLMRGQAERMLRELDVVRRDEFEAVKDMARLAREENEALKGRLAALEAGRPASGPATTASMSPGRAGSTTQGTGQGGPQGTAARSTTSHLPSDGVQPSGPPKTGPQTPSRPTGAAGDPSI